MVTFAIATPALSTSAPSGARSRRISLPVMISSQGSGLGPPYGRACKYAKAAALMPRSAARELPHGRLQPPPRPSETRQPQAAVPGVDGAGPSAGLSCLHPPPFPPPPPPPPLYTPA